MVATLADKSPADLIADYLDSKGNVFGGSTGWAFSVGFLPDGPDQVVAILDASGPSGFPTISIDFPGIQVIVRGSAGGEEYKDSWLKVKQVKDYLLGMPNAPAQFPELWGCVERGQPIPIGADDKNRPRWSYNLMLTVGPNTTNTNRISA